MVESVIRVLPPEVVNRIAAGEVVERPASILKELLENSIDASASEISVELEEGGKKRVLVRDNGCGMSPQDLPLAFASHATSKLDLDDLERNLLGVSTMGFRGEALASIGAIAMVEVTSRTPDAPHACRYRPGTDDVPRPAPGACGTAVDVANIFYNTPARRKFLRRTSTELSHCLQQFTRVAVAFPGVRFHLKHGGKRLLDFEATEELEQRLAQILGEEVAGRLLKVVYDGGRDLPAISGFVGSPLLHRRDTREQHFFVNGRWVRDRAFSHALRSAFDGFQIPGKHPVVYVFLDVAPEDVDVNVHPTKTEVRFRNSQDVYGLLRHAVRRTLEARVPERRPGAAAPPLERVPPGRSVQLEGFSAPGETPPATFADEDAPGRIPRLDRPAADFPVGPEESSPQAASPPQGAPPPDGAPPPPAVAAGRSRLAERAPSLAAGGRRTFQLLDTYILVELERGFALIDQHALHEKILFEEIFARLQEGVVEKQKLILPDVVDLTPELVPRVAAAARRLAPFGFEIEPFGERSVAVQAIPALFDREAGSTDCRRIVLSVLEDLDDDYGEPEDDAPDAVRRRMRHLASTIACKRAVKAGMRLSEEQIVSLLERGSLAEDPRYCPHGRPTTVVLHERDIEKQFDRK